MTESAVIWRGASGPPMCVGVDFAKHGGEGVGVIAEINPDGSLTIVEIITVDTALTVTAPGIARKPADRASAPPAPQ